MPPSRIFHSAMILSLLLAATGLSGCGKSDAAPSTTQASVTPAAKPVSVTVVPAKAMDLQRSVRIVGSLAAIEKPALSNRVTGTVSKIYVDVGDRVAPSKSGEPGRKLLEIESRRFDLAVQNAAAVLEETLSRLGLKTIPSENFDIDQTAPVQRAQSEYDNAKQKLDRSTPLYQQKIMKEFEYFDIQSAFKVAESNLQVSRDQARSLLAKARQDQANLDLRKKDLEDTSICSPDGSNPDGVVIASYTVSERKVSVGEYLKESTPLFVLVADSTLKLQARVPERFLADVALKSKVLFSVDAYAGKTFEGTVHAIDPSVDPASRTFMIEAYVDNPASIGNQPNPYILHPGSFVQGNIMTKLDPARVMVPIEALTSFVGVTKAYVVVPDSSPAKVKAVDVERGQQEGQWVETLSGIHADDLVVTTGATKLFDGSLVEIETSSATASAPATESH